jgi:hypothetical protein
MHVKVSLESAWHGIIPLPSMALQQIRANRSLTLRAIEACGSHSVSVLWHYWEDHDRLILEVLIHSEETYEYGRGIRQ